MKTIKFSILIPVIKGAFLTTTIESVMKQTYSDWEIILYNDCSKDDIDTIIKKYRDNRIKYFKGKVNLGYDDPSKTWNHMLALAHGQYICLLCDDDYLSENYLEEMVGLITQYPDVAIFRAALKRIDENNNVISVGESLPVHESWQESLYQRNIKKRTQSTCEFVLHKKELEKIGGYVNFPRACGSDDATYLLLAQNHGIISTNNACGYWRKSSLNISDNDSHEMNVYKIRFLLEWERNFIDKRFSPTIPIHEIYKSLDAQITEVGPSSYKIELDKIHLSYEWQVVLVLRKLARIFIPKGSTRRKIALFFWHATKKVFKKCLTLFKKIKKTYLFFKNKFYTYIDRVIVKNIQTPVKKVLYVGHSYHNKTKSSSFFTDYLKEFYTVEVLLDESWLGRGFHDLSFVDHTYEAVIFWQNIPPEDILKTINSNNIIFFPMYDDSGMWDYDRWKQYKDIKIINFSRTLHDRLVSWGFNSMYIQYFPEPKEYIPGSQNEAFFWQRITKVNINTVTKLFTKGNLKIHIHKAVDPHFEFVKPSQDDEQKFSITYSDWFPTQEEMSDIVKTKGIYVAPREFEGIGLSFLEAMAMGKAVVAVDNPTMNEYIEDGKTGYLFDVSDTKEIDLSHIDIIQKNTHAFIHSGYDQWMKNKYKIIEFIKK